MARDGDALEAARVEFIETTEGLALGCESPARLSRKRSDHVPPRDPGALGAADQPASCGVPKGRLAPFLDLNPSVR